MLLQGLMDGAPFTDPPSVLMQRLNHPGAVSTAQSVVLEQPVRNFLEVALPSDAATQQEATDVVGESQLGTEPMPEGEAQEDVQEDDLSYNVPKDVLVKWGHVIDIVTPDSCMTNCFTKTYTRFAKVCSVRNAACFGLHTQLCLLDSCELLASVYKVCRSAAVLGLQTSDEVLCTPGCGYTTRHYT